MVIKLKTKVLDINNIYIHSIREDSYKASLAVLRKILKSGYIKSQKSMGKYVTDCYCCQSNDEICLTEPNSNINFYDNNTKTIYYDAVDLYVSSHLSLIIVKNIKCYKPLLVSSSSMTRDMRMSGKYTDIYNECRTKNDIPIENITGVLLPSLKTAYSDFYEEISEEKYFKLIKRMLRRYQLDINCYEYDNSNAAKMIKLVK